MSLLHLAFFSRYKPYPSSLFSDTALEASGSLGREGPAGWSPRLMTPDGNDPRAVLLTGQIAIEEGREVKV